MSIAQLSPNSVNANPAHINPQVRTEQAAAVPQVNQESRKSVQETKTDTVTISAQALKKLSDDGDSKALEVKEAAAEKTSETYRTIA